MSNQIPIFLAASFAIALSAITIGPADAHDSDVDVFITGEPTMVVGSATLDRDDIGVRVEIETTLVPGDAHTVWWIIFNNPGECDLDVCAGTDLGNPDVNGAVLHATGGVADGDGNATFNAFLPLGLIRLNRTADGRERHRLGPGLQNPKGAEIHMVIRTHGLASGNVAELIEQMSTFGGLCDPGPMDPCADVQAAIFPGDDDDDDDDDD
jgi:hypothetical protein